MLSINRKCVISRQYTNDLKTKILLSLLIFLRTLGAYTLYYIFGILCNETFGHIYNRDEIVLEAIGLSTVETGEMNMIEMLAILASAYAILMYACAVIYDMKEHVLCKQAKGTKNRGTVKVW